MERLEYAILSKNMLAIGPNGLPEVHDPHGDGLGRVEEGGNDLEGV